MPLAREDFSALIRIFAQLLVAVTGKPLPKDQPWLNDGQVLLIKTFRHLESIEKLVDGVETQVGGTSYPGYIDHSSIAVLARAAFETYSLFHFIFCDEDSDVSFLRYRVWRMVGLKERQQLIGSKQVQPKLQEVKDREKAQIDRLWHEIENDPFYRKLSKQEKDAVKNRGDEKFGKRWAELAERAGLPRLYSHDMYKQFCNYAHASSISVFQIHDAIAEGEAKTLASVSISFCALLTSQLLISYADFHPAAKDVLLKDEQACTLVDRWLYFAEELERGYEIVQKQER